MADEEQFVNNEQQEPLEPSPPEDPFVQEGAKKEMDPEKIANFSAGCAIMFGAILGMVPMLMHLSFFNFIGLLFVFYFGLVVAVEESPAPRGSYPSIQDYEFWIPKYASCMKGMTGKGVCLFFIGCTMATFATANFPKGLIRFMNVAMMAAVVVIGGYGAAMGYSKSGKLNKVRDAILGCCPGGLNQIKAAMVPYAIEFPAENGTGHALNMAEFNKFVEEVAKENPLGQEDLVLAFKALRQRRPGLNQEYVPKLTMTDVDRWLTEPLRTFLL